MIKLDNLELFNENNKLKVRFSYFSSNAAPYFANPVMLESLELSETKENLNLQELQDQLYELSCDCEWKKLDYLKSYIKDNFNSLVKEVI